MSSSNKLSNSTIITDINWNDNGKITFSFQFHPQYGHSIVNYELWYCYINGNDNNWYRYASNNWKRIVISTSNFVNNNIELRIATNKDIYDANKCENIELLMKLRCETKATGWIHTFYAPFSEIYFVKSLAIPSILNKKTQIFQVLETIFDVNNAQQNNQSQRANGIQHLVSLYEKYKNHFGIDKVFTKLWKQYAENFYEHKYSLLLFSNNNVNPLSLSKYVFEIDKHINYEKQNFLSYIEKYCNDNDSKDIIRIIVNKAFDFSSGNQKIKQLFENQDSGINNLFIRLVCNQQSAMQDLDRLLECSSYFKETKQTIIEGYFSQSIRNLFAVNINRKIFDIHDCILSLINTKLQNTSLYHDAMIAGMNDYLHSLLNTKVESNYKPLNFFDTTLQTLLFNTEIDIFDTVEKDLLCLGEMYAAQNGQVTLAELFRNHISKAGLNLIDKSKNSNKKDNAHELSFSLINLHNNCLKTLKRQFKSEQIFHKALKEGFEEFMNKEYYTSALLARFANDVLKKESLINVPNFNDTMDHIVTLYGYIRDKDIFERDYQQYLASRLLQNLCQEELERCMITKLKSESGYHWTSKLQDMFKDVEKSKELMQQYNIMHQYIEHEFQLNVSVCTTGAWPTSSIQPVKKPFEVAASAERYTKFYLKMYNGRRLNFQMDKGKAEVVVIFSKNVKRVLVVSSYQMLVLLLFVNDKQTWSFGEMQDATGIPKEDLQVAVLSMSHPKVNVLLHKPNTKDIADDHQFRINSKYTNPRVKIPIPTLNIKTRKKVEEDKEMESVYRLRRYQMDEAIVRCAKPYRRHSWKKKPITHPDLVTAVVKFLRGKFTPKPVDIKKRIANLIELEYLERDQNDRQKYWYIGHL